MGKKVHEVDPGTAEDASEVTADEATADDGRLNGDVVEPEVRDGIPFVPADVTEALGDDEARRWAALLERLAE